MSVRIATLKGKLIEQGEATLDPGSTDDWRYVATKTTRAHGVRVHVEARDLPGNVTVHEEVRLLMCSAPDGPAGMASVN